MKVRITPRKLGEIPIGGLFMLPLFLLPLGAQLVGAGQVNLGTCGFKVIAGLPCLTCGSTRATIHLFEGHFLEALRHQPMMLTIYAALILWGTVSLWAFATRQRVKVRLSHREDFALKVAIVGIPLTNWVYLVWAGI